MTRPPLDRSVLAFVAALLLSGGFLLLGWRVEHGPPPAVDLAILHAMRGPEGQPAGPAWVQDAARDFTSLGSISILGTVVVIFTGYLVLARRGRTALALVGATVGGTIVATALKSIVGRQRPTVVSHLAHTFTESFPSGHAFGSAVVYLTVGVLLYRTTTDRALRAWFLAVAFGLTLIVGVTRIYLGVHYPSDVLGGWMGGVAWALYVWLVVTKLQRRGQVEPPQAQ